MKNKLLDLGLSEKVVDEILSAFELYEKSCMALSKPKGEQDFDDHISEIVSLSGKLSKRLGKLTRMEKQLLDRNCFPGCFQLQIGLNRLNFSAKEIKGQHFRSARRPFLLALASNVRDILDQNGIPITIYKKNTLPEILNILLESDPDSEKGLNLLRQLPKK
jgi:hypothetical protein